MPIDDAAPCCNSDAPTAPSAIFQTTKDTKLTKGDTKTTKDTKTTRV
jgi:hypothetical protein